VEGGRWEEEGGGRREEGGGRREEGGRRREDVGGTISSISDFVNFDFVNNFLLLKKFEKIKGKIISSRKRGVKGGGVHFSNKKIQIPSPKIYKTQK
jgi:hypothetical protein